MKKRRELDALVGNGKLPRRKSKSGHELLRSDDSDSSEVEEFSVQVGKKSDRKWAGFCSCSTCLGLSGFVILMVCFITCTGLIWMHFELKRDLDSLRNRIATVDSHGRAVPEELQIIKRQLQSSNRTMQEFKKGELTQDKQFRDISAKITTLSVDTESIKQSLKTAPELQELPKRVETLSSSVAELGSDTQVAKKAIEDMKLFHDSTNRQLKDLTDRITAIEASAKTSGSDKEREEPHDSAQNIVHVPQVLSDLGERIFTMNNTFQSAISALSQKMAEFENRLGMLENVTVNKKNSDLTQVTKKLTLEETTPDAGNTSSQTDKTLDSLLAKVENITVSVSKLKELYQQVQGNKAVMNVTKPSLPAVEDFSEFKEMTQSRIQDLNVTVVRLQGEVSNLYLQFTRNSNNLVNVSSLVDGIFRYLGIRNHQTDNATWELLNVTRLNKINDIFTSTVTMTSFNKIKDYVTTTAQPSSSVPDMSLKKILTSSQPESKKISIVIGGESIDNMKKLDKYFNRWDKHGIGFVDAKDLPDFLGPAAPSEDQLKPFDLNEDGMYSKDEFAKALGITGGTCIYNFYISDSISVSSTSSTTTLPTSSN